MQYYSVLSNMSVFTLNTGHPVFIQSSEGQFVHHTSLRQLRIFYRHPPQLQLGGKPDRGLHTSSTSSFINVINHLNHETRTLKFSQTWIRTDGRMDVLKIIRLINRMDVLKIIRLINY